MAGEETGKRQAARGASVPGVVLLLVVLVSAFFIARRSPWLEMVGLPAAWAESDFQILYAAGAGLAEGRDVQDPVVLDEVGRRTTGREGTPFCAALPLVARGITALSSWAADRRDPDGPVARFHLAYAFWVSVGVGLLVLTAGLLSLALVRGGVPVLSALAVALATLALDDASWMSLAFNSTNLLALTAIAGALLAGVTGRPRLEGALLALAAVAKLSPVLLIVVAAAAGRWRTVRSALVALVVFAGLTLAWLGTEPHARWIEAALPALSYAPALEAGHFANSLHEWNLSPNGLLSRALVGGEDGLARARQIGLFLAAGLLLATLLLSRRASRRTEVDAVFATYALGVSASLLLSSVTWPHHLVLVALPACWLVLVGWRAQRGVFDVLLAAGAVACILLFLPFGALAGPDDPVGVTDSHAKSTALVLLFATVAGTLLVDRQASR